jgi:hypothetical protein
MIRSVEITIVVIIVPLPRRTSLVVVAVIVFVLGPLPLPSSVVLLECLTHLQPQLLQPSHRLRLSPQPRRPRCSHCVRVLLLLLLLLLLLGQTSSLQDAELPRTALQLSI